MTMPEPRTPESVLVREWLLHCVHMHVGCQPNHDEDYLLLRDQSLAVWKFTSDRKQIACMLGSCSWSLHIDRVAPRLPFRMEADAEPQS